MIIELKAAFPVEEFGRLIALAELEIEDYAQIVKDIDGYLLDDDFSLLMRDYFVAVGNSIDVERDHVRYKDL